jgi:hypothetical protein
MGGLAQEGNVDDGPMRKGGENGSQQPLRKLQHQGALQLGQKGEKSLIVQQRQMPALQLFHRQALRGGTPHPVHAQTQPLDMSQAYGHDRERPHGGPNKQQISNKSLGG